MPSLKVSLYADVRSILTSMTCINRPQGSPWNDHQNATGEEASLGYGVLTANAISMRWDFFLSESGMLKDTVTILK